MGGAGKGKEGGGRGRRGRGSRLTGGPGVHQSPLATVRGAQEVSVRMSFLPTPTHPHGFKVLAAELWAVPFSH